MRPGLELRNLVREGAELTRQAEAASRERIAASRKDDERLAEITARAEEAISVSRDRLGRGSR